MDKKMNKRSLLHLLLFVSLLLLQAFSAKSQSFIGVNYGEVADNLPPTSATASLLQSTTISTLRLYGADAAIIKSLAGTNVSIVLGVPNGEVPTLASDPSAAAQWAAANVLAYLPASSITIISVGNEALNSGDASLPPLLLPAMKNLRTALASTTVKVSTVHSMAILSSSDPPSSGAFRSDLADTIAGILSFLRDSDAPLMINPYPYFAYRSDTRPETLAFCLFEPGPGRLDPGSNLNYANMFDAQVDAVRSALDSQGFKDIEIVVAETGWPYKGDADEVGATVDNARLYVANLVAHLRTMAGTPKMPGKSVDTYLFALYDEDLKPGPASERSFGLYRADQTMNYDAGLEKFSSSQSPSPTQAVTAAPKAAVDESPPPDPLAGKAAASPQQLSCEPAATVQASANGRTIEPRVNCNVPDMVGSRWEQRSESLFFLCLCAPALLLA